jgi:hypothetical protein
MAKKGTTRNKHVYYGVNGYPKTTKRFPMTRKSNVSIASEHGSDVTVVEKPRQE